jgi:hypothetical protein
MQCMNLVNNSASVLTKSAPAVVMPMRTASRPLSDKCNSYLPGGGENRSCVLVFVNTSTTTTNGPKNVSPFVAGRAHTVCKSLIGGGTFRI